jgi:Zn-dependent M28 family amino/carboxypeptidase
LENILEKVDEKRLYSHIRKLMGPNDPIYTPAKLESVATYIATQLELYGLQVHEHVFTLDGKKYRNIEGVISTGDNPELLLTSHYDTVPQAPGADDNLSAVSVTLEAARILSELDTPQNVRVISFTLEEGPPEYWRRYLVSAQKLGLMDDDFNYLDLNTSELRKKLGIYLIKGRSTGKFPDEQVEVFMQNNRDQMNEAELEYFMGIREYLKRVTSDSWIGELYLTSSGRWVKERSQDVNIGGVINFDTIGYTSKQPYSQAFPPGINPDMFTRYLVEDPHRGDYLFGIADDNSKNLLDLFSSSCFMDGVELPFAGFHVPYSYDVINQKMRDLALGDQAPFWKNGFPAIYLNDTGKFRTPYWHTQADTIDKLDINFLAKICKATTTTATRFPSSNT